MPIWVDADSCPNVIKEILYRAAARARIRVTFIANKPLRLPPSPWLRSLQVDGGFDAADRGILERMARDDLVVTADVPLAAAVIDRGGLALTPRGERYTPDNVRERLSIRDFTETLRGGGLVSGGAPALDARDRQRFANALDAWLARRPKAGDDGAATAIE
jgi:hypothetical protein